MKMSREKRALLAGMIGCLLYVIGDFLYAWTGKDQSTETIRTDDPCCVSRYGRMAYGGQHSLRRSGHGALL